MIQSSDKTKLWYSDIKNELLSYKKVHSRTSGKHETFTCGRKTVARLIFRGKTLCLLLSLSVADYATRYPVEDANKFSGANTETPLMLRLKNSKCAKSVKPLIAEVMKQTGTEPLTKYSPVDYCVPYEENEALIEKGLIKRIDKTGKSDQSNA